MRNIRNNVGGADQKIWAGYETSSANRRQKTEKTRQSGQRSGFRKALSCLLCLLILVSNLLQPVAAMDLPISFDPDHPEKTIVLHRLEKETESDQNPPRDSEEETESETESDTGIETITEAMTEIGAETEAETGIELSDETEAETEPLVLVSEGADYRIVVTCGPDSGIPYDAELKVSEILPEKQDDAQNAHESEKSYEDYVSDAESALDGKEKITFARFFDICIMKDGEEIQPAGQVSVRIELPDELTEDVKAVHFEKEEVPEVSKGQEDPATVENPVLLDAEVTAAEEMENAVVFETGGFSVFGVFGTTIEKTVLARNGRNYRITVTYGPEAGIPDDADLSVEEILPAEDLEDGEIDPWQEYVFKVGETLGWEGGSATYIRLFDIRIVDKNDPEVKYQPAEGTTVDVKIELADAESEELSVVHFAEEGEAGDKVENTTETAKEGQTVAFEADGFSVYAIVDAPEPVSADSIKTLEELAEKYADFRFYLSYNGNHYFTNELNNNSAFNETTNANAASYWQFEKVDSQENQYYIYTLINGEKQYMYNKSGNLMDLSETNKTAFELSEAAEGKFYFKVANQSKWLQHSNGGGGIRLWTDNNNAANSQITITCATLPDDTYSLDGKTYGIAYHNESVTSAALTAEETTVSNQCRLKSQDLVMRPDVLDNDGILLVAENSDIQEWTFVSVGENRYHIKTNDNKYLTIDHGNVTLTTEPDPVNSVITVVPGTGANSGKWHFSVNGYSLNLQGSSGNGFNAATGTGATTWMNLVEKSVFPEEDFTLYSAKKVSVSDTDNVYTGQKVIIYTRVWNDTTKRYEFYAIDHDGSLIRCYDTGDTIEWTGSKVNTALWEFTEGKNTDGSPSYYYWLENAQYDNTFIVPHVTNNEIIYTSTEPDGTTDFNASVNLNGRRYGKSQTTIISWDDHHYSYSGLKVENGHLLPSALSDAEDFYFAVMNPIDESDQPTTVNTIVNDEYGISMRMIDYQNDIRDVNGKIADNTKGRDSGQTAVLGYDTNTAGLLSNQLGEDGYPVTVAENTGKESTSLSNLFNDASPVDHLFIESIHSESGYFEYNSTSNFAELNEDGTFTVYDQLGAIGDYPGSTGTGRHGQFMPYDELTPGKYVADFANETDVLAHELPDTDPRKGEKLYNLGTRKEVDYFFGMEMEASFTQTADGLDAWGHDIIFEFSGDDDFWFYVDGVLVLDLGGVHSAMTGSINFRTGEVKSSRGNTTLYDIFKAVLGEAAADEKFTEKTVDGKTVKVFNDYSQHDMKMFYMERGAGASNLHMRFNLAAVKPGTVELSKKLSGTDSPTNNLIEFPYQIYYTTESDGEHDYHLLEEKTGETYNVTYKGSVASVPFAESFTPTGESEPYQKVFFLKAGETAVINLPKDTVNYKIVECGINPAVYVQVKANGVILEGAGSGARKDFATSPASTADRPTVEYDNHVNQGAMRTLNISKSLYSTDGSTQLHYDATEAEKDNNQEDRTLFEYRLYLGGENVDPNNLPGAMLYPYYVKNRDEYYCRWDADSQSFKSLGIDDFSQLQNYLDTLTSEQRENIVFITSPNGSITKIAADYTVEVRDLVIGTQWKVEERDGDIPAGYTRRESDGYVRKDLSPNVKQSTPISGTMGANDSPQLEIQNQKGWGLTVKKKWTDKDFMSSHDSIYFAVYLDNKIAVVPKYTTDEQGETVTTYRPSVRQMKTDSTELYYFFGDLHNGTQETYQFSDYVVREVSITVPQGKSIIVDKDGYVINLEADQLIVTPIDPDGTLYSGGTPVGGVHQDNIAYTVSYDPGQSTGENENIRTDTVINSRPGIEFYKEDWNRHILPGAVFTLKDNNGGDVGAASYTSGSDGLITIAYLSEEKGPFKLTEIGTPKGYVVLDKPITITLDKEGGITFSLQNETDTDTYYVRADGTVTGSSDYFRVEKKSGSDMTATVTVKNRTNELKVIKVDETDGTLIEGVHFALYNQVIDGAGNKRKDYTPIAGYEDLVTDKHGIVPRVTMDLQPKTYYLTETQEAGGYDKLTEDICFTIGQDGRVAINDPGHPEWLKSETVLEDGITTYTLTIPNGKMKNVSFLKVDASDSSVFLKGAEFDLYSVENGDGGEDVRKIPALYEGLISGEIPGEDGMLAKDGQTVFELPVGRYHLVETKAPDGYNPKTAAVVIDVTADKDQNDVPFGQGGIHGVAYNDEDSAMSVSTIGIKYESGTKVYTLKIINSPGIELPSTGGRGTCLLYLFGILLTGFAAAGFMLRRRKKSYIGKVL